VRTAPATDGIQQRQRRRHQRAAAPQAQSFVISAGSLWGIFSVLASASHRAFSF
jgi:hypothetical protein